MCIWMERFIKNILYRAFFDHFSGIQTATSSPLSATKPKLWVISIIDIQLLFLISNRRSII
jgi:hypothetical protein